MTNTQTSKTYYRAATIYTQRMEQGYKATVHVGGEMIDYVVSVTEQDALKQAQSAADAHWA